MNDTDIFAARAATLPPAPRQALCPAFSADPAILEIHDCLCDLNYLAFRALRGSAHGRAGAPCSLRTGQRSP